MQVDVVVMLGTVSTALGISGTVYGFKKSGDKTIRDNTSQQIELATKLNYIIKSVDEIKFDLRAQDTKINSLSERLTKIEEVAKSAHHRIDSLEKQLEEHNR